MNQMTWKFGHNSVLSRAFQQGITLDPALISFWDNGGSRIYLSPCTVHVICPSLIIVRVRVYLLYVENPLRGVALLLERRNSAKSFKISIEWRMTDSHEYEHEVEIFNQHKVSTFDNSEFRTVDCWSLVDTEKRVVLIAKIVLTL